MAFGHAIEKRLEELARRGHNLSKVIAEGQQEATEKAVQVATELTSPNDNTPPRGAGMITGDTKAAWATDSITKPKIENDQYTTILGNNKQYISYINDGFFLDKHYVPGLIINPYSDLLEKVNPVLGGIVVGTQTTYIRGIYMRETALANYRGTLERNLISLLKKEVGDG